MRFRIFVRVLMRKLGLTPAPRSCGFCAGTKPPLAAAPRVAICADCISAARRLESLQASAEHLSLKAVTEAPCSFCVEPQPVNARSVRGKSAAICSTCLVLAEEMLSESPVRSAR